jgi:hypothetical protein
MLLDTSAHQKRQHIASHSIGSVADTIIAGTKRPLWMDGFAQVCVLYSIYADFRSIVFFQVTKQVSRPKTGCIYMIASRSSSKSAASKSHLQKSKAISYLTPMSGTHASSGEQIQSVSPVLSLLILVLYSIPDEYSGEVPLAFIALSDEAVQRVQADPGEERKIKAGVAKHVADAKIAYKHLVGGVQVVDVIPKNPRRVSWFGRRVLV